MLQFHRVTIGDKPFVDAFTAAENSRSADFNFGNIYLWDSAYRQFLAGVDGRLLTKLKYEDLPFFAFPIGTGDIRPAIEAIEEFCAHDGCHLRLRGARTSTATCWRTPIPVFSLSPRTGTTSTTSTSPRNWPRSRAKSSTASATSATASRRSTAGSSSP